MRTPAQQERSRRVIPQVEPLAFVIGVVFIAVAGGVSMEEVAFGIGKLRWLAAPILLTLGVVLLLAAKTRD